MDSDDIVGLLVVGVIALIVILFVIFGVIVPIVGWHHETGRGEHTGYVTAVETNGVFFKTNRAYVKTDTQSSQEDQYCVIDPTVLSQIQDYAKNKTHVDLYYFSWIDAGIRNCKGEDAIIYKVEPAAQ